MPSRCGGKWVQVCEETSVLRDLWEDLPASQRLFGRLHASQSRGQEKNKQWSKRVHAPVVGLHWVTRRVNTQKLVIKTCSGKAARRRTKWKSIARSRQTILIPMPEEHRVLISGDSVQAKLQAMDDEKAALLAAKRQFLPLQSRIEKQKQYSERIFKDIEKRWQARLEIVQRWIEANQASETAHENHVQTKQEMAQLLADQTAENAKSVDQGKPEVQAHKRQWASFQTRMRFLNVSNLSWRCKAMAATSCRNSSWRLGRQKTMSNRSARSWYVQCSSWKLERRPSRQIQRTTVTRGTTWVRMTKPTLIQKHQDFNDMSVEGQETVQRSLSNANHERKRLAK